LYIRILSHIALNLKYKNRIKGFVLLYIMVSFVIFARRRARQQQFDFWLCWLFTNNLFRIREAAVRTSITRAAETNKKIAVQRAERAEKVRLLPFHITRGHAQSKIGPFHNCGLLLNGIAESNPKHNIYTLRSIIVALETFQSKSHELCGE
jgi:hypothetical protein